MPSPWLFPVEYLGSVPAVQALELDESEAAAQLIEADLLSLDLADLIRAESGTPSNPAADNSNIDAALLEQLIGLNRGTLGIPLIGDGTNGGLLNLGPGAGLGLLNGHASAPNATSATAASGAVTSDGSLNVGAINDPTSQSASIELTALLGQLGLTSLTDEVIDNLSLELGALATTASAQSGQPASSQYTVAGAEVVVSNPLVGNLTTGIDTAVGALDTTLDGLLGPTGAVQQALNILNLPA